MKEKLAMWGVVLLGAAFFFCGSYGIIFYMPRILGNYSFFSMRTIVFLLIMMLLLVSGVGLIGRKKWALNFVLCLAVLLVVSQLSYLGWLLFTKHGQAFLKMSAEHAAIGHNIPAQLVREMLVRRIIFNMVIPAVPFVFLILPVVRRQFK